MRRVSIMRVHSALWQVVVCESNRWVMVCIKSRVMRESDCESGASEFWIGVVNVGNMCDKWNLLCL